MASDGVTGAATASMPVLMTMAGFLAISLYNVLELMVIILTTFKQRSGLYFWSFIVSTLGIAPHAAGFVLKFFGVMSPSGWWLPVTLVAIGFPAMVTGQSMVLYSRLHLVVRDPRRLRLVLYMVIFDGVVMSIPLIVLAYGSNSPNPAPFLSIFTIWDKVQIAVFAVQEIIISVLYIYETSRLLNLSPTSNQALRKMLIHLLAVNAVVLIFDITLLGVQYSNNYEIQTTYKGAAYSVKLKLEFSVLNNLINIIKNKSLSFGGKGDTTNHTHALENIAFNSKMSRGGSDDFGLFFKLNETRPLPLERGANANNVIVERIEPVPEDPEDVISDQASLPRTAPGKYEMETALPTSDSQAFEVELTTMRDTDHATSEGRS